MPGLPFDILASSVMTGQQTKSTTQEGSGEESIFSQNLESALQSVLSKKGLKNGETMENAPALEAIKTLDTLKFVDLTKFAALVLDFEEELAEIANVKGLSTEEEEILKLAFWQGLMQMMAEQPKLPDSLKIQSFINNFNENKEVITENAEKIPLQQLQSMVQNIGKKQYLPKDAVIAKLSKDTNEISVKEKTFVPLSEERKILEIEKFQKNIVKLDKNLKSESLAKTVVEPLVQKDNPTDEQKIAKQLKVIQPLVEKNNDHDVKLKEVENFRDRFIAKVNKDVIQVASKNQEKLPPQLLKLINKVNQAVNQQNQKLKIDAMSDLQRSSHDLSIKINSNIKANTNIVAQNAEKATIAKVTQPSEADTEILKQIKAEDSDTKTKVEQKEKGEADKTEKYKLGPKLARAYIPARSIQQLPSHSIDILSKYNSLQSEVGQASVRQDLSFSVEDVSSVETQPMKLQKTIDVGFEAQRQTAETSKPEMSDAPKFNSDPTRTAKLMQSVKEHMRLWVDKKYTAMKIQVEPAELGKIQLKTVVEQGKIGVLLQAESSVAKELLSQNIMQMKEMLESMGLNVATFTVADWDESGFKGANQQNKSSAKFNMKTLMEESEPENMVQNNNHGLINRVA